MESNEALALDIFPSTQIYYLTVNTTKPPFDDVKVRQALYYALNKSELASAIAGEYGTLWPPLSPRPRATGATPICR